MNPATLPLVGSPEWVQNVGLNFEVEPVPVLFSTSPDIENSRFDDGLSTFRNRVVLRRKDNKEGLGIVSKSSFKLVQPAEILEFYRGFSASGGMNLIAGGVFKGGARIWAQAELDCPIQLPGNDLVFPQFLLSTSYNGETGSIGTFTTRRVYCENSLNMALSQSDTEDGYNITGFSIPHHREFNVVEAQQHVSELLVAAKLFEEKARAMTEYGLSADGVYEFVVEVAGSKGADGQLTPQSKLKINRILELFEDGPGADAKSAKGTLWGALNAVTCYVDHEAPSRTDITGRTYSAWFGEGKSTKVKALHLALKLVG